MIAENQYPRLYQQYQWLVPAHFQMADACCTRWATQGVSARQIALYLEDGNGSREVWTFERLHHDATRLAHALLRMGLRPGQRMAIILPARGEFLVCLMAAWMVGAIAVPLSVQLDGTLLERSLRDSGSRVAVMQPDTYEMLLPGLHRCTQLQQLIGIDLHNDRAVPWRGLLARQPDTPLPAPSDSTAALLFYDTRPGIPPRGFLHAHRALVGVLPGFVAANDWFPHQAGTYWVGLDWTTAAALLGGILPCLYFGMPLVAQRGVAAPFADPKLLERYNVTHMLTTPLVLQRFKHLLTRQADPTPGPVRTIVSTGLTLPPALQQWYADTLGIRINNTYSATATPLLAGQSQARWSDPPGSLGRAYPGHQLQVLDEQGHSVPIGTAGELTILPHDIHGAPDPLWWEGPWPDLHNPAEPYRRSGDLVKIDDEARLWWVGRADQLLQTPDGPVNPEILEAVLLEHPAVAEVGVVALSEHPDPVKFKAWVVPAGESPTNDTTLATELLAHGLAHWPAEVLTAQWVIEFTPQLPRQPSGRLLRQALRSRDRSRRRRRKPA